jgi:hypothetical protein
LKSLQKHVLAEVEGIVGAAGETQQVIEDALLPARDEVVKGLDVAFSNARNQVRIFDGPKDQTLAPCEETARERKKSMSFISLV